MPEPAGTLPTPGQIPQPPTATPAGDARSTRRSTPRPVDATGEVDDTARTIPDAGAGHRPRLRRHGQRPARRRDLRPRHRVPGRRRDAPRVGRFDHPCPRRVPDRRAGACGPGRDDATDPTTGRSLYIEIELPEIRSADGSVTAAAEHWVMTEAWWAQRVAPPPFAQMAQWLGPDGAVRRIVTAMFAAQGSKDPRQRDASQAHLLVPPEPRGSRWPVARHADHDREPGRAPDAEQTRRHRLTKADAGTATEPPPPAPQPGSPLRPGPLASVLERFGVRLFLQAVSALGLLLYGFLRSIEKILPIGPLKDGALTRPIDTFLLDWFGDVYVLLGDPAQCASVRARLIERSGISRRSTAGRSRSSPIRAGRSSPT